nr:PREDICTED: maltase A1-like [Bemisia tabaci]
MQGIHVTVLCGILMSLTGWTSAQHRQQDWYETTLEYQIYPRSFKDSDGDGTGDIKGIIEKLDYLADLGVETIWLQPFYKSPMRDNGYDVSDFRAPDPMFGSMDDVKNMIRAIKERGMKLVIDFVVNHSSDEHEWFKLSEQGVEPYKDYYIWNDGKKINETHSEVPNNWVSIFEGSAWTWSPIRKQYYYHAFAIKQPDLNFRNPKLREEINNLMRFWMDLGVDGFRVDAAKWLFEATHLLDEPIRPGRRHTWFGMDHIYTLSQPESFDLAREWRMTMEEQKKKDGVTKLLSIEEFGTADYLVKYMGNSTHPGAQMPFNFHFKMLTYEATPARIAQIIRDWQKFLPEGGVFNWAAESHDRPRLPTRMGPEAADSWNMLQILLPGILNVYYGMELGMEDCYIRPDQRKDAIGRNEDDPTTRDTSRTPMMWDDTKNAGFSTAEKTWLPVHPNYFQKNVKSQLADPHSHLNTFKRLVKLRKTPIIKLGRLDTYVLREWVFMYTRILENETVLVIVNLGTETEKICAKNIARDLPDSMTVHTPSFNSRFKIGDKVTLTSTGGQSCSELRPKAGLVLTNTPAVPEPAVSSSAALNHFICLIVLAVGISILAPGIL